MPARTPADPLNLISVGLCGIGFQPVRIGEWPVARQPAAEGRSMPWVADEFTPICRTRGTRNGGVRRWRPHLAAALAATVAAAVGCTETRRGPAISTLSPEPLEAQFDFLFHAPVVSGRYLVLPVRLGDGAWTMLSMQGSTGLTSQSWAEMRMGRWLNLHIVDLQDGRHMTAVERQVALGEWHAALDHSPGFPFPGLVLLVARAADTNGDRQIDEKDEIHAFAFDLASGTRRQLSPSGHSARRLEFQPERLLLTLSRPDGSAAVYEVDPQTSVGRFVVERMRP
jgi:hypothetical protein